MAAESLTLLLHNLADLHRRVEELCGATVEADGLALVELALAVVVGDTLLLARVLETAIKVSDCLFSHLNSAQVRGWRVYRL